MPPYHPSTTKPQSTPLAVSLLMISALIHPELNLHLKSNSNTCARQSMIWIAPMRETNPKWRKLQQHYCWTDCLRQTKMHQWAKQIQTQTPYTNEINIWRLKLFYWSLQCFDTNVLRHGNACCNARKRTTDTMSQSPKCEPHEKHTYTHDNDNMNRVQQ